MVSSLLLLLTALLSGWPTASQPGSRVEATVEAPTPDGDSLEVVFVENEGFLLAWGDRKVLVDGLFHLLDQDRPSLEVRSATQNGEPPFQDLDLIVATHTHRDHFQVGAVVEALRHSPRAVFLGTPQAIQQIRDSIADLKALESRIRTVDLPVGEAAEFNVAGIRIRAMSTGHGGMPDIQNYMVLMERNGITVLHEGDSDIARDTFGAWQLALEGVDVAFFHHGLLLSNEWLRFLEETVNPRYFFPMHISPSQAREAAPRLEALSREDSRVRYLRRSMDRVVLSGLEPRR